MGRLDGLVNNAARFTHRPVNITEADWDFIHSVNLEPVFSAASKARALMGKTGGGAIVNISSLGGIRPGRTCALLRIKTGVIMLTRALAKAFAPDRVNSVAPGVVPFGEPDERAAL